MPFCIGDEHAEERAHANRDYCAPAVMQRELRFAQIDFGDETLETVTRIARGTRLAEIVMMTSILSSGQPNVIARLTAFACSSDAGEPGLSSIAKYRHGDAENA